MVFEKAIVHLKNGIPISRNKKFWYQLIYGELKKYSTYATHSRKTTFNSSDVLADDWEL